MKKCFILILCALALIAGVALSWLGAGLFPVAVSCCAVVLVAELFLV